MKMLAHEKPLLSATGLASGYDGRLVLNALSISVQLGERIALIGPNGSGKSTLLRTLLGLLPLQGGVVSFGEADLSGERVSHRVRRGIAYMKQADNIFNDLTVRENLELAARSTQTRSVAASRIAVLCSLLPTLASFASRRAGLLSGGQRQILALTVTLSRKVDLVLLDEPIAGLAVPAAQELLRALDILQAADGFAVIVAEHRLRLIESFVNRVVVMREGNIIDDTRETHRMLDARWLARHYGFRDLE